MPLTSVVKSFASSGFQYQQRFMGIPLISNSPWVQSAPNSGMQQPKAATGANVKEKTFSQICTALTFLAGCSGLAQTLPATIAGTPEIVISVYDYAHMPSEELAVAEADAQRIFRNAGLETTWLNCLRRPADYALKNCYSVDSAHLVMKILPRESAELVRDHEGVLGDAFVDMGGVGYFAYAFYDHIENVAARHELGPALLGCVLAHEIGHLLLGSKSHAVSGIMSAHWSGEELRRISEQGLVFLPSQSRALQNRVTSLRRSSDPNAVSIASGVSNHH